MFVCLCNGLRETDIEQAVAQGAEPTNVHACLGCKPVCGQCIPYMADYFPAEKKPN